MKNARPARVPWSAASALAAALVAIVLLVAAAGLVIYAADVAHQVAGLQESLDRNLNDNCANATRRAAYSWINDHCVRFEREHRVGLSRKAMDIVMGDVATLIFIAMTEYQPFDANYIKVVVLVLLVLGFYIVRDYWSYAWMWAMYKEQRHAPPPMLMARAPAPCMHVAPLPTAASEGFLTDPVQ